MSDYNSVNEEIRAQNEKVKQMPLRKRLQHYWYYNKWILFAAIGAFLLIYFIIDSMLTYNKTFYVTGIFINCGASPEWEKELEQAFAQRYDINTDTYSVDFDYSLSYEVGFADPATAYTPVKMVAYSEGHVGDFVLCDEESFGFFADKGYFADLSEVLSEEQFLAYEPYLYYYDAGDLRGSIPTAIRLPDISMLQAAGCYLYGSDDILFTVFYLSEHKTQALQALEFFMQE